tara:strand:+ start:3776 stop:3946 length:171 start_codon:yes stop_codon:yes gene_type:complete
MKILDEVPADNVRLVDSILRSVSLSRFVESWALAKFRITNAVFTLRSLKIKIRVRF